MREGTTPDDLSDADLVEVAFAGDLVEGEMIRGLLRERRYPQHPAADRH